MYLHLGRDTVVNTKNIISIMDLESTSKSKYSREFLKIVELIAESYSAVVQNEESKINSDIVVLVGPAGSGKTKLATRFLEENDNFEKLISYTTKDPTALQKKSVKLNSILTQKKHQEPSGSRCLLKTRLLNAVSKWTLCPDLKTSQQFFPLTAIQQSIS